MILPYKTLKMVACAASDDEIRYSLNGVHIEPYSPDELVIVASDGRVLIAAFEKCEQHGLTEEITIPTDLIRRVKIRRTTTHVEVNLLPNRRVEVCGDGYGYTGRLINGHYPVWRKSTRPTKPLVRCMPEAIGFPVLNIIQNALVASGVKKKDACIQDVYAAEKDGVHYMQLTENAFLCFMPMRYDPEDSKAQRLIIPEWAF